MSAVADPRKIDRVVLNHTDDVEASLRGEVLAKAYDLFGYKADTFGSLGPLAKVLNELGIAPLNQAQVDAYKKSKEKEWTQHRRMWSFLGTGFAVPAVIWGLFFAVKVIFGLHERNDFGWIDGIVIACAVLTIIGIPCAFMVASERTENIHHVRDWKKWDFGNGTNARYESYQRYVPVHLLNFAVAIKSAEPKVIFYVEELQHTSERIPKPLPDPFLVVSLGSERYTIGVWDEREYEAKA